MTGRSAADAASGLRPSGAEPQDASQAKPLVPNAAHIVTRRVGSYEYTETLVAGFPNEAEAERFIIKAEDEWKAAVDAVPDTLDYPPDNAPDEEWAKWARRRKAAWKRFRAILTCDPDAAPDGEWASPDEPTYYPQIVPLFASAMSASGQDRETGLEAKPASAVPKADARTPTVSQ